MELTAGIKGSQEMTAGASIEPYLDQGFGTVGTQMNVKHQAATPIGRKIRCESELIQADGRRLVFTIKAFDEAGQIGEGEHERFIVQKDKFQEKALRR